MADKAKIIRAWVCVNLRAAVVIVDLGIITKRIPNEDKTV